mmetsp:Transcript_4372/g.9384  ORF Transcript_4372/g.9384 Transcript_4372/m.9384 type:complete len:316 (-) Transcript_4372:232-1179(-)|eukprot:CAMPEP_0172456978 /NCGR_PEP_ID=MMETSP1065-20121228/18876_1 /TAXON_ID=265537 /ORGANISM="Amphiprora paludosa, Strain CCMP125" /LENGTH=315 /DNA_ID=CAMNT_0013210357 /DNA_START=14 /DNA_END=961 /DNA_ORIENTATION=-
MSEFAGALDSAGGEAGKRDDAGGEAEIVVGAEDAIDNTFRETTKLVIKQKFEPLEALANAAANAVGMDALGALGEVANKYDAFTDDGGLKFRTVETSEYCGLTGRCCCRPNHKLQLHVYQEGNEVMYLDRGCKCGQCFSCHECCRQEMKVHMGPGEGEMIAHIMEPSMGGGLSPTLQVMDRDGNDVATIKANATCCIGGICCDHTFTVEDPQGNSMGKIVKERPDGIGQFAKELVSDADVFSMDVPKDMDPKKKAAMFSALHLIDYWLFESEGEVNVDIVNGQCSFKCCDLYCFGCVCPCSCTLGGGDGEDGGGD